MCNIVLIGFMGSGKSSVGRRFAEQTGRSFMDMDKLIEQREGRLISDIFEQSGEDYFRALETRVLAELSESAEHMVISTGGGLPVKKSNHQYLKKLGTVVYLTVNADTVQRRLAGDTTRPLLAGGRPGEKIEALLQAREPIYREAADVVIATDRRSFTSIVNEMEEILK